VTIPLIKGATFLDQSIDSMVDVAIIGAGPVGLACAIEAEREGLKAVIIEKGALVNSIVGYPNNMEFFSTPELIEIGNHPFPTTAYKPTREEAIEYYRRVADVEGLDIRLYERVERVEGERGGFSVVTENETLKAAHIVVSIGFFDHPNRLNIPGEDLPKVTHYYKEPYPYARQRVAVIGARNSAAKAALDCYRHGADVTLIVRAPELSDKIKYWILPDLQNRIKEGSIHAYFSTAVTEIREDLIVLATREGDVALDIDWVIAMTGYHPDYAFLESLDIELGLDAFRTPHFDEATFESSRAGLYLAGTVCGGYQTNRWFIENGRFHAKQIMKHIAHGERRQLDFEAVHWKTAE
jgi:thioredoxin reductase (NADPH)